MELGEAVPSDADMLYWYTLTKEDCDDFESSAVCLYAIRRLIDSIAPRRMLCCLVMPMPQTNGTYGLYVVYDMLCAALCVMCYV